MEPREINTPVYSKLADPDIPFEVVTILRPASDAFTSNAPKTYGGGARLIRVSLPRIKWLERGDVDDRG